MAPMPSSVRRPTTTPGRPAGPQPRTAIAVTWLLAILVGWCPGAVRAAAADAVATLQQALVAPGRTASFPADSGGTAQALPLRDTAALGGSAWVRLRFHRPADAAEMWAVRVPPACGWLDVDLNGQALHRDPPDSAGSPRCPQARWFTLPAAGLRPGVNTLDLRLRATPADQTTSARRAPLLPTVQIGPAEVLGPAHARAEFWSTTAVRIVDVTLVLLGAFMLLLAANRHGAHLAHFALAALCWAAVLAPVWWTTVPLPPAALQWLLAGLLAPATSFGVQYLMRFANLALPRLRQALIAQGLLLPLVLALVAPDARATVATVIGGLLGLEIAAALVAYLVACRGERRHDALAMAGILALAAAVWVVEAARAPAGLGTLGALRWVSASPFGMSVLLIAVGAQLLHLFNRALVAAEASRQSLETRVQEITVQIEHNFAQLSEMRVEQLTQKERKRIAADLHDDLGAKLLTIVHTCDNERIAALGREALDDMRLSVRGLNGRPMRLVDAMADWRAETVQRLGQTNIQVEWLSPGDEVDHLLPARAFVQTTRILREAVSNIIKHSGASHCQVVCFAGPGEFGLVIEDTGRGIAVDFGQGLDRGHGLASMKNRAKQLQGQCLVESGPGAGTVIRLTLPL